MMLSFCIVRQVNSIEVEAKHHKEPSFSMYPTSNMDSMVSCAKTTLLQQVSNCQRFAKMSNTLTMGYITPIEKFGTLL